MRIRLTTLAVAALASMLGACTVEDTKAPPLSGPSEMSLSLSLTANPDVLSLDGASQSQIVIEARDENGQLAPNVPMRVEILADGVTTDFGTISARTLVTGSNGRASFTYTAPSFVAGTIPALSLSVTPTGTDASEHLRRIVSIRLVAPGVIGIAPTATFTFTPESPVAFTNVIFDGATSTAGLGAIITSYRWDFGDGSTTTTSSAATTHQYGAVGTYRATLTVTDTNGLSSTSAPQFVTVEAGEPPTAVIVVSPTNPAPNTSVFFNGSTSVAGTGHRIVSYRWNFGDGSASSSGVTRSHTFTAGGNYVVVLTVTDEVGQIATANVTVPVQ